VDPVLFFILAFTAAFTVGPAVVFRHMWAQAQAWWRAVERAGVRDVRLRGISLVTGPSLEGRAGDLVVSMRRVMHSGAEHSMSYPAVHVEFRDRPLSTMGLASERAMTPYARLAPEMEIGDPAFDAAYWVTGTPALARAHLDAELRRLLCAQDGWGLTQLSRGKLRTLLEVEGGGVPLENAVRGLLAIARRLAEPVDVPERLADLVLGDPMPGVRRETLRALVREFPDHPRTDAALRQALADPEAEVRVRAATALGAAGTATLHAIATDPGTEDSTAALAVTSLERRLPTATLGALLDDALRRRRLHTARACLEQLGRGPAEETMEPLVKVLGVDRTELAPCAARALGRLGSPAAEGPLLAALEREVPGLRTDAAEALGRVGTVGAVLPLKEAAVRWSGEGDFPRIARQAVAAIQERAAGAAHGQLALAEDESGRISLADGTAGQLSMPAGEPGRLSVTPPRT
jgi:hypothetical protein